MARKDAMFSLRLPSQLLEELDAEVDIVAAQPEYAACRITRGVLVNMALDEWLKARKAAREKR